MKEYAWIVLILCLGWHQNLIFAQQQEDICKLPPDSGPCRARKLRVFFNTQTNRCEYFFYGGCKGNENNFKNVIDCHNACKHNLNNESQNSTEVHLKSPHCMLPPVDEQLVSRKCRAYFQRYTFNSITGKCQKYIYGGCGGTQNLYSNRQECFSACFHLNKNAGRNLKSRGIIKLRGKPRKLDDHSDSSKIIFPGFIEEEDICKLPPIIPGPIACIAYMPKWTYDYSQGKCVSYIYGGCRGTDNLFPSKEACEKRCSKSQVVEELDIQRPPLCNLPPINPPPEFNIMCLAFSKMYTFDSQTEECKEYIYGGCFGTENLFNSKTDCLRKCDPLKSPKPKTVESCGAPLFPSVKAVLESQKCFVFNYNNNKCESRQYLENCDNYENAFHSVEDCVNTCGGIESDDNPLCSLATCNQEEQQYYKSKACQPIFKPGECCPSSWDCSLWEERLHRKNQCFVANEEHPMGKYYNIGDEMPELSRGCSVICRCNPPSYTGFATPICALVDCFGMGLVMENSTCKNVYSDKYACCNSGQICDEELEQLSTCSFENKTYVAGEKMYSDTDSCKICHCSDKWRNGEENSESCYIVDPYSMLSDQLVKGCQPIFREGICGSIDWRCPDDDFAIGYPAPMPRPVYICPEGSPPIEEEINRIISPAIEPLDSAASMDEPNRKLKYPSDVCLLSKPVGVCQGFMKRWYFNRNSRRCEEFKYGGYEIEKHQNIFATKENCMEVCNKYAVNQDKETITCEDISEENSTPPLKADRCVPRKAFRFNKSTGKCENFGHFGCQRNMNSFSTIEECEAICIVRKKELQIFKGMQSICNLPVQSGKCRSRLSRYYYDTESGLCRKFWFSGCQGNENNFMNENECISTCISNDLITRALIEETLEIKNVCDQDKETGPCRAERPKWYFDKNSSTCKIFGYGGCQGNDNNFNSFQECSSTCPIDEVAQESNKDICNLPVVVGRCRASFPRYFFNSDSGECELFNYGGCGGNENNFKRYIDCKYSCEIPLIFDKPTIKPRSIQLTISNETNIEIADSQDPCLLDKEIGICRASFKRYYFDRNSKQCQRFIYGGCLGNANNFGTYQECKAMCGNHMEKTKVLKTPRKLNIPLDSLCSLPMDSGPCKAYRPKWFYNTALEKCEEFFWGGCKGNSNRFASKSECMASCKPKIEKPLPISPRIASPVTVVAPKLDLQKSTCKLDGQVFNKGDLIKFNLERCRTCICNSPPELTCYESKCPEEPKLPDSQDMVCNFVYDTDGCCKVGIQCVSANPPSFNPNEL